MRAALPWGLLLLSSLAAVSASDDCYGADVVIEQENQTKRNQIWYGLSAPFGGSLPKATPEPLHLVRSSPLDACHAPESQSAYAGNPISA